jgi:hypothetical protein
MLHPVTLYLDQVIHRASGWQPYVRTSSRRILDSLKNRVSALPMRGKISVEIKEIDPLISKKKLAEELVEQLGIKDNGEVEVNTLRLATWGTQSAIVTLPKAYLVKDGPSRKIRICLTIATIRALPNVVKCYRCHMLEHMANKCTAINTGKEICKKCGGKDHMIAICTNAPCCAICSKETGVRFDHVTGSLACPGYRRKRSNEDLAGQSKQMQVGAGSDASVRDGAQAGYCYNFRAKQAAPILL